MPNEVAPRDGNHVPTLLLMRDDGTTTPARIDPVTGGLKVAAILGGGTFDDIAPTTTKGDMIVHNGTANVREPVGTNGQVLMADSAQANGIKWATLAAGGDVNGPASSTDNAVARFDSTTGKIIQNSAVTIDDSGNLAGVGTINTLVLPASDFVGRTDTQTLTNKTLTNPTLTTPTLGVATATSINKVAITAPATGATLTIADGKTLTFNNSVTLSGTDGTTMTFPSTTGTVMVLGATQTNTAAKTFNSSTLILAGSSSGTTILNASATASGTLTLPAATDTLVARDTTDTLTNKTLTTPTITKPVMSATNPTAQTYTPSAAATATLDLSLSNQHRITMPAGNITIALSNDTNSQIFIVSITQDGTGSRTVTWFSTIRWAGGSTPTLTTAANKRDVFGFIRTGSGTYDGFIIGQNI